MPARVSSALETLRMPSSCKNTSICELLPRIGQWRRLHPHHDELHLGKESCLQLALGALLNPKEVAVVPVSVAGSRRSVVHLAASILTLTFMWSPSRVTVVPLGTGIGLLPILDSRAKTVRRTRVAEARCAQEAWLANALWVIIFQR